MSEQDSKMSMLQFLAPNAMKAYKRKKLTFFPSASANNTLEGQAEMELDSGDGTLRIEFTQPHWLKRHDGVVCESSST